jgi:hypothetical protein
MCLARLAIADVVSGRHEFDVFASSVESQLKGFALFENKEFDVRGTPRRGWVVHAFARLHSLSIYGHPDRVEIGNLLLLFGYADVERLPVDRGSESR